MSEHNTLQCRSSLYSSDDVSLLVSIAELPVLILRQIGSKKVAICSLSLLRGTLGFAILDNSSCGISVILISKCGIAVISEPAGWGF